MAPERVQMADHVTHPLGQTDADDHCAASLADRAAYWKRVGKSGGASGATVL